MKILYSPQFNPGQKINYIFDGDIIYVEYKEQTDVFDFTGFTDGEVTVVETNLPFIPVISAKRENGILHVELLYLYDNDATHEELFPEWVEV